MITLMAAIGERGELGKGGHLLWKIPEDLQFFKEMTLGEAVVMGRKTWDSLWIKPLPDRHNIVVTRDPGWRTEPGVEVVRDVRALEGKDLYVIGGGEIYRQTLPMVDTLRITRVFQTYPEADTFFPPTPPNFKMLSVSEPGVTDYGIKYQFETWIRQW